MCVKRSGVPRRVGVCFPYQKKGHRMKKIFALMFFALAAFAFAEELTRAQYREDIDSLEEILTQYCASYEAVQKSGRFDIDGQIRALKKQKLSAISCEDFFDLLCDTFENIPDHHLCISYLDETRPLWNKGFAHLGENHTAIVESGRQLYLAVYDCSAEIARETVKRFESLDLVRFDTIIIDLRGNPGGEFETMARILCKLCGTIYAENGNMNLCSQMLLFKESPYYAYYKDVFKLSKSEIRQIEKKGKSLLKPFAASEDLLHATKTSAAFGGKIFVLVDGCTGSSAEEVTLLLRQNFENATVLGIETAGAVAYGGPLPAILPNSKIQIHVTQFQTIEAALFEDLLDPEEGIQPDIVTETTKELKDTLTRLGVAEDVARIFGSAE